MIFKLFKLKDSGSLVSNYKKLKWRAEHNAEIFGGHFNFSFKSRCRYAFKHPVRFIKDLYLNSYIVTELIKAWYVWRQNPLRRKSITSKKMFAKHYQ